MGTPSRILVAADDPTDRLILTRSLEKGGYEVLTADGGFEAVSRAAEHHPDLILMDVMTPGRDGLEACNLLKAREDTAAIPLIFVTAVTDTHRILQAFAAGACDYITKPFKSEEVLARCSVNVRLRQAEAELLERNREMEKLAGRLADAAPLHL